MFPAAEIPVKKLERRQWKRAWVDVTNNGETVKGNTDQRRLGAGPPVGIPTVAAQFYSTDTH